MWRISTFFERTRSALSIAEAETLQNVVAPVTLSGPALRSCLSIEQTAAVFGVLTVMSPFFVQITTSFVSEMVFSALNFGRSFRFAAVKVFVQATAGRCPLSVV